MTSVDPELSAREYTDVAESAWRWVLHQVRWDDGPWIPTAVPGGPDADRADADLADTDRPDAERADRLADADLPDSTGLTLIGPDASPPWDRDGVHSGVGGLAQVLAEIRLARAWTGEESDLAAGIADRVRSVVPDQTDCTLFDGLVSTIGTLTALRAPGADAGGRQARGARDARRLAADVRGATAVPPGRPDQRRHARHGRGTARGTVGPAGGRGRHPGRGAAGTLGVARAAPVGLPGVDRRPPRRRHWPSMPPRC